MDSSKSTTLDFSEKNMELLIITSIFSINSKHLNNVSMRRMQSSEAIFLTGEETLERPLDASSSNFVIIHGLQLRADGAVKTIGGTCSGVMRFSVLIE